MAAGRPIAIHHGGHVTRCIMNSSPSERNRIFWQRCSFDCSGGRQGYNNNELNDLMDVCGVASSWATNHDPLRCIWWLFHIFFIEFEIFKRFKGGKIDGIMAAWKRWRAKLRDIRTSALQLFRWFLWLFNYLLKVRPLIIHPAGWREEEEATIKNPQQEVASCRKEVARVARWTGGPSRVQRCQFTSTLSGGISGFFTSVSLFSVVVI